MDNKPIEKNKISKEDLIGSYEELYSNYYNKLLYASTTNNRFLSFRTMIDAQAFFDDFTNQFDISKFHLIEKYNPNNLKLNVKEFEKLLNNWLKMYNAFGIEVEEYNSINELYSSSSHKRN